MANKQKVELRQKPSKAAAATKTKSTISLQQSMDIVQTALHASLSALAYLRLWFPADSFDEQLYENGDYHWTYNDYIDGKTQLPPFTKLTHGRTVMRVLRRGRSTRADKFLDWLEKGVFDALREGYLHALTINVSRTPNGLSKPFEMYTFTVNYTSQVLGAEARRVSSVQIDSPNGEQVTIKDARWMMQRFVREILVLTQTMNDMPKEAYLRMHLQYNDHRPEDYEPPFFMPSEQPCSFLAELGFSKNTVNIQQLKSGHLTLTMKLSHLVPIDDESRSTTTTSVLRDNQATSLRTQQAFKILKPNELRQDSATSRSRLPSLQLSSSSTSRQTYAAMNQDVEAPAFRRSSHASVETSPASISSGSSEDLQTGNRLREMLPSMFLSQGPGDTQRIVDPKHESQNLPEARKALKIPRAQTSNRRYRVRNCSNAVPLSQADIENKDENSYPISPLVGPLATKKRKAGSGPQNSPTQKKRTASSTLYPLATGEVTPSPSSRG